MPTNTLYIFLDEGGNLDFSPRGTNYFVMSALTKVRPFVLFEPLINLKYDLWEKGVDFEYFHATEDTQLTRNEVFKILTQHLSRFTIDSVIIEKRKTHPTLQNPNNFYQKTFEILFNYIFNRYSKTPLRIFIITDTIPIKKKRKEVEKAIKLYLSQRQIMHGPIYTIKHLSSKSDINLQIIDYFNWAIFRKWERKDSRSYDLIKDAISSEFDAFKIGRKYYY